MTAALLLAVEVLLSGCGTDGSAASTSGTSPTSAAAEEEKSGVAYAQCMRENGVPKFPDPDSDGGTNLERGQVDIGSDAFKKADQVCRGKLPMQGSDKRQENYQQALKYAACIRKNGVPNFPDPPVPGDGPNTNSNQGKQQQQIDPSSPAFQAAQAKCKDLVPEGSEPGLSGKP